MASDRETNSESKARDMFAAAALQGLIASQITSEGTGLKLEDFLATASFQIADAMMAQRRERDDHEAAEGAGL